MKTPQKKETARSCSWKPQTWVCPLSYRLSTIYWCLEPFLPYSYTFLNSRLSLQEECMFSSLSIGCTTQLFSFTKTTGRKLTPTCPVKSIHLSIRIKIFEIRSLFSHIICLALTAVIDMLNRTCL